MKNYGHGNGCTTETCSSVEKGKNTSVGITRECVECKVINTEEGMNAHETRMDFTEYRQLVWYSNGNTRMGMNTLSKMIIDWSPHERGRTRKTWWERIRKARVAGNLQWTMTRWSEGVGSTLNGLFNEYILKTETAIIGQSFSISG